MRRMLAAALGGALCAGTAALAYGVRGRSAGLLAPSVWRGPRWRRFLALTFDDGPSESTPELLEILDRYGVRATFFQCGANIRRLPAVARQVAAAGHEIGNHSDTHPRLYFRPAGFIERELERAQRAIEDATGAGCRWFRPPYGARWFGLRAAQRRLGLTGVMWTLLARDWRLPAATTVRRLLGRVSNGAILCLHDGRRIQPRPDVRETLAAVARLIPALRERGFGFETVSQILCPAS
ncbi:MAG: polysaccharide deacetylase family protein [Acidobacteria bacterium]|nr:polysaccharide deacetylase family protein [Acidobacteriota bacterium]